MPPDDRFDVSRLMATALQILTEVLEPPVLPDVDALGTESPPMRRVMALAARTDATVLITGESGVGKPRRRRRRFALRSTRAHSLRLQNRRRCQIRYKS